MVQKVLVFSETGDLCQSRLADGFHYETYVDFVLDSLLCWVPKVVKLATDCGRCRGAEDRQGTREYKNANKAKHGNT